MASEVSRLRDRLSAAESRADAAEARLSAATALLGRVVRRGPTRGDGLLNGDVQAFLANQPAAPTLPPLNLVEDRTPEQLAADGDAAPARTEAERKPHRRECTAEWCDIGCDRAAELAAEVRQRVRESTMDAKRQVSAIKSPAVCALFDAVTGQAPARTEHSTPDADLWHWAHRRDDKQCDCIMCLTGEARAARFSAPTCTEADRAAPTLCTCSTDCEGICPACRPIARRGLK